MGWVYHGEYLHYFERARSEFIRVSGMSYAEVERRGVRLPVREAGCRYRASILYDELIWIRAGIRDWGRASMTFIYEIWDSPRAKLHATGFTQHACVDPTGKPMGVPGWLKALFVAS